MTNQLVFTKKWEKQKKWYKNKGLENPYIYMLHVEEIVKMFMIRLDIFETVEVVPSNSGYSVDYSSHRDVYILNVPLFEIENTVVHPYNLPDIRTNICHELGHIYYKDPRYFNCLDKTLTWTLRNKIVSALAETRADIFADKYTQEVFGSSSFKWVDTDPIFIVNHKTDVSRTGYLKGRDRQQIGQRYTEYTNNLIRQIFFSYLSQYATYEEIVKSVKSDLRLKDRKNWIVKVVEGNK